MVYYHERLITDVWAACTMDNMIAVLPEKSETWAGLRTCARLTGIAPSTLSSWVNEYGWVRCQRNMRGTLLTICLDDVRAVLEHHEVCRGRPRTLRITPWGMD